MSKILCCKEMEDDLDGLDPEIFKKLKMNGLVLAEDEVISGLTGQPFLCRCLIHQQGCFGKGLL